MPNTPEATARRQSGWNTPLLYRFATHEQKTGYPLPSLDFSVDNVTMFATTKITGQETARPQRKTPTIQDAKLIARTLVKSFAGIDAVLLYGSVARGDANEWSDIDLMITGSDRNLTPERLRKAVPQGRRDRVSLIYYPTPAFRRRYRERALFIAHLKMEGVALFDRLDLLKAVLSRPFVPVVDVSEGIKAHLTKLSPYSNPRRFNNNALFCLAHLYSIGKGVIMLGLARHGVLEFNREVAFSRFVALSPDLWRETNKVARLRPFYRLVTGRQPEPLPFSYRAAHRQMRETVTAIQTLAKRAEAL